jgi:hypothetical protein
VTHVMDGKNLAGRGVGTKRMLTTVKYAPAVRRIPLPCVAQGYIRTG